MHVLTRPRAGRVASRFAGAMLLLAMGCTSTARLPPVDLDGGGWTLRTGQAVWKPGADREPLAGELLLARHAEGDVFVTFSKPPLPIFTARTAGNRWSLDLVERSRSHSGRGRPPGRFVWFALPALLDGGEAPGRWVVERAGDDEWSLEHPRGDSIFLVLDPAATP